METTTNTDDQVFASKMEEEKAKKKKQFAIEDWVMEFQRKNKKLHLEALIPDIDNAPILNEAMSRLIEQEFELLLTAEDEKLNQNHNTLLHRLFMVAINKEAIAILKEKQELSVSKIISIKKRVDEEGLENDSLAKEYNTFYQESVKNTYRIEFIDSILEQSKKEYLSNGTKWIDNQEIVKEFVSDPSLNDYTVMNNKGEKELLTASTLLVEIDKLIDKVDLVIQHLDALLEEEFPLEQNQNDAHVQTPELEGGEVFDEEKHKVSLDENELERKGVVVKPTSFSERPQKSKPSSNIEQTQRNNNESSQLISSSSKLNNDTFNQGLSIDCSFDDEEEEDDSLDEHNTNTNNPIDIEAFDQDEEDEEIEVEVKQKEEKGQEDNKKQKPIKPIL